MHSSDQSSKPGVNGGDTAVSPMNDLVARDQALAIWVAQMTRRRFLLGVGLALGSAAMANSAWASAPASKRSSLRRLARPLPGWPRGPVTFVQIGDFGSGNVHDGHHGPQPTINPNAQQVAELVAEYAPVRSQSYVVSAGDNVYVPYYGDPPNPPPEAVGTNQPPPGDAPQTFVALNITPYDQAIGALYASYIQFPPESTSVFARHGSRRQRFLTVMGDHDWWHQPREMVNGLPVYPMDTAAPPAMVGAQPQYSTEPTATLPSAFKEYFGNQGARSSSGNPRYWDVMQGNVHWIALSSDANETVLGTLSNAFYSTAPLSSGLTPGQDNLLNSTQGTWFQAVTEKSAPAWRFVLTHYPPYTSSSPSEGGHNPAAFMQWPFEDYGVDMVFSGHVHSYERLYVNGVTYIVNGAGGTFEAMAGFSQPVGGASQAQVPNAFGALMAEIRGGKAFFSYLSLPPADPGVEPNPSLGDRFVLLKRGVLNDSDLAELQGIHVTPGGGAIRIGRGSFNFSGNLLGPGLFRKIGAGEWVLSTASPNFTGTFSVVRGGVTLGCPQALATSANLQLRGGLLNAAEASLTLNTPLQLAASSTINLTASSELAFADSSSTTWARQARLIITGSPGTQSLRFGTTPQGLTPAQLGQIRFGSRNGSPATLDANGYLVPA